MDKSDLNIEAKRKKLSTGATTLRDRVSRDACTIVGLRVAQDAKIWDLKEQLHQTKNNYERLQQTKLEVQMEHEATMAQYQEEMRLRLEMLNKVKATCEICSVLEEYSERLKDTLTQCKADQALALSKAYQKYEEKVEETKQQQLQKEEKLLLENVNMQGKMKLQDEYLKKMQNNFECTKQQLTKNIQDIQVQLKTVSAQKDELTNALNYNVKNADLYKQECDKKGARISTVQNEMQQLIREYTNHNNNMEDVMSKQENDLKEYVKERDSLKNALEKSEQYRKSVCDEKKLLQEKISVFEEENKDQQNIINEFETKLKDATITIKRFERGAAVLVQNTKDLEKTIAKNNEVAAITTNIFEKDAVILDQYTKNLEKTIAKNKEHINSIEGELKCLKSSTFTLEKENVKLLNDINHQTEELKSKTEKLDETSAICKDLKVKIQIMDSDNKTYIEKSEANIKKLQNTIQLKDKDLKSNAAVVNKLMTDIKQCYDDRNKLEMDWKSAKQECEMEKEQLRKTQAIVKNKDDELAKQMSVMFEIMNEKKRFQETIQEMQSKIHNIQKKITGPPPKSLVTPADLDDNAVMAPATRYQLTPSCPTSQPYLLAPPPAPERRNIDAMIFNIFSEDSAEGDCSDSSSKPPVTVRQRNRIPTRPAASQGAPKRRSTDTTGFIPDKTKERKFFKTK